MKSGRACDQLESLFWKQGAVSRARAAIRLGLGRHVRDLAPGASRTVSTAATTPSVIAQSLFVSLKTVEKHLGNAYTRLGIASRADVAGLELD